ncbi:MAG: hypothetical protein HQM14_15490 [SAR324 cluster bacterium]|nr:hypothetical protein [SAR324 cluster bacterium]
MKLIKSPSTLWYYPLVYRWVGAYDRHLDKDIHHVGKRNTEKIEHKHLTLRTRIKGSHVKPDVFLKR